MNSRAAGLRCLALLACAVLSGALAAQAESKPAVPYWRVESIVPKWFSSRGPARDKVFEQLKDAGYERVTMTKAESERVVKLTRSMPARPVAIRAGMLTAEQTVRGEKLGLHVFVPRKYTGKQRVPLVIALHGGGSDTQGNPAEANRAARDELAGWQPACESGTCIAVAPSTTDEYWAVDRGREIILGALSYALANYEIDCDRVLLTGSSLGGFGTFWWAPILADRFALAAPFIGGPDVRDRLGNCRHLPMYVMIGSLDPMLSMKEWVRENVAELKKLGYDVTFHEYPGLGHEVPREEASRVMARLAATMRPIHAKHLTRTMGSGPWYWIEAEGRLDARIVGNVVTIDGPKAARVLLSDAMVDLEKPVRIVLNGTTRFEGKVDRSLGLLIDQIRTTGDASRVFCAAVEIR